MECKVVEMVEIRSVSGPSGAVLTLGEVVAFHIDERFLLDGRFDTSRATRYPLRLPGLRDSRGRLRDGSPKGRGRYLIGHGRDARRQMENDGK